MRRSLLLAVSTAGGFLLAGCAGNPRVATPAPGGPGAAPVVASAPAPSQPHDSAAEAIAASERLLAEGEQQLRVGHLADARERFDRAVGVLLDAVGAAPGSPDALSLREHLARLVDRISTLEALALARGDGFAEKPSEPASIDELLSTSVFEGLAAPPAPEIARAVEADLAATAHDVPIPFNTRVLAYVELFTGRLRDWMAVALQRATRYLPMIQSVFRAEGLPLDLAYVPLVESAFKPDALSRASAKGVWQFMRGTAVENGLRHDWFVDERADPEKSTLAAARYLRTLHEMFGGDWHLALASYNGGPGRVQRALKRAGVEDFWRLSATSRYLPRETREYVPMILAAMIVARNPVAYGFEIEPQPPVAYDRVSVPPGTDLRRIAEWAGTSIDEIQALNPELRRWTTPVRGDYEVKVPAGSGPALEARLAQATPGELSSLNWHTVRKAETLTSVARRFKISRAELAAANDLSTRASLRPGQRLLIPRAPVPLVASSAAGGGTRAAGDVRPASAPREASPRLHTVKPGETLFAIARAYGLTVDVLKALNRLQTDVIQPGLRLLVQTDAASIQ
jgi:membrane-bound lytic murein transglycosylase D